VDKACPARVSVLGIQIDRLTSSELLRRLDKQLSEGPPGYLVTPNVDHLVQLKNDSLFKKIYDEAAYTIPDGMPILWAAKWLGKALPERITGADLFPRLCQVAAVRGYSVFLLGSTNKVCRHGISKLYELYPNIKIAGYYSPLVGFEKSLAELSYIVEILKQSSPDIVLVGLGAPKQEKLIWYLRSRVPVKFFLGVGAAFDFFAQEKKRAPLRLQRFGLEWAFRLLSEPRRLWKRYLIDDPRFFWWVAKEKFAGGKND